MLIAAKILNEEDAMEISRNVYLERLIVRKHNGFMYKKGGFFSNLMLKISPMLAYIAEAQALVTRFVESAK